MAVEDSLFLITVGALVIIIRELRPEPKQNRCSELSENVIKENEFLKRIKQQLLI